MDTTMLAGALLFLVAALAAVVAWRTLVVRPAPPPGAPDPALAERFAGVEDDLAALVRIRTVSAYDGMEADEGAFAAFRAELARRYPLAHRRLLCRDVGPRALLYEWPGTGTDGPVLLAAHYDVVPEGDAAWTRPPFSGDIADGCVWGRGTQDTKATLAGALAAAESLLAEGFTPARTVFFGFGGDEETGGARGAATVADYFERRGIRLAFLLDEGGAIVDGLPGIRGRPLALVGVSEKGYADLTVEAPGAGGVASVPSSRGAAWLLARAVIEAGRRLAPARFPETTKALVASLAPAAPFPLRIALANPGLFAPILKAYFGSSAVLSSLVRTTTAVTTLSASGAENVLPNVARANVNVSILPGETVGEAMARVARAVGRFGATARLAREGRAHDPLPESPASGPGWDAVTGALAVTHPEALPVPFIFGGGTDTKHYRRVADAMYRFSPLVQSDAELARVHAADERLSVANARRCASFYRELMARL